MLSLQVYFAACEYGAMDFRTMPSFFNMVRLLLHHAGALFMLKRRVYVSCSPLRRLVAIQAEIFKRSGVVESHFACSALYAKICEIVMAWFEQDACNCISPASVSSPSNNNADDSHSRQRNYSTSATP